MKLYYLQVTQVTMSSFFGRCRNRLIFRAKMAPLSPYVLEKLFRTSMFLLNAIKRSSEATFSEFAYSSNDAWHQWHHGTF